MSERRDELTARDRTAALLLTAGGLGRLRPALVWVPAPAAALAVVHIASGAPLLVGFCVMTALIAAGVLVCGVWGRRAAALFGRVDAPEVVSGKVGAAGLPMAEALYYQGGAATMLGQVLLAWALFAGLDAARLWPIRRLQRLPSGWGVVGDLLLGGTALVLFNLSVMLLKAAGVR